MEVSLAIYSTGMFLTGFGLLIQGRQPFDRGAIITIAWPLFLLKAIWIMLRE